MKLDKGGGREWGICSLGSGLTVKLFCLPLARGQGTVSG